MNSKTVKTLRRELEESMGVSYRDAKYQQRIVRWLVCPPHVRSRYPVYFIGILLGHAIPVTQRKLQAGCGRAIYKLAKKLLDTGNE